MMRSMKSVDMKTGVAILCVGLGWSTTSRGEDLTTLAGQTYSNIVVQQSDWEKTDGEE